LKFQAIAEETTKNLMGLLFAATYRPILLHRSFDSC